MGEKMTEEESLRLERLALLIGTMVGQISELLNYMKLRDANINIAYESLFDIHNSSGLQLHKLYYGTT